MIILREYTPRAEISFTTRALKVELCTPFPLLQELRRGDVLDLPPARPLRRRALQPTDPLAVGRQPDPGGQVPQDLAERRRRQAVEPRPLVLRDGDHHPPVCPGYLVGQVVERQRLGGLLA